MKQFFNDGIHWYRGLNRTALVSALLIVVILSGTFLFPSASQGATFTFNQTSWAGGVTANNANHDDNRTGWTEYTSGSNVAASTTVSLSSASASALDDSAGLTALSPSSVSASSFPKGIAVSPSGTSVYIVTEGSNTVSMYSRNTSTGALSALSPATLSIGTSGQDIVVSPDGTSVYLVATGGVHMFSRNTSTGALAALSPATIASGSSPYGITISPDGTSVYATNASSNTVAMYSRNTSTGALTALATPTIASTTTPQEITISPDGTSVYVANSGGNVTMYSRNTSTGALTALATPTIAAGTNPLAISISSDGLSVYVTNQGSNTVSMYSRNTSTGALTALATPTIGTDSTPFGIVVSPDGMSVYVTNFSSNTISLYSRNIATGALTAFATSTLATGGSKPYRIAISPNGASVYATHRDSAAVFQFRRAVSGGAPGFEAGTLSSTLLSGTGSTASIILPVAGTHTALSPSTIAAGSLPKLLAISPDGTSVYVANNFGNNVLMYSRNLSTGALTALGTPSIASGSGPFGIVVSADGTSVYVANQNTTTVSMYSRNTSTGALTALGTPTIAAGTTPTGVAISSDGTSVYVTNGGSNTVSMYSRNTSTGALTALGTPTIATGTLPYGITIAPDGTSVYVTNQTSNTVSMYSRNTSTGALTALGTPTIATATSPFNITISADGTSVYVANASSNSLSMYSRNTSTGALTALATPTIATASTPRGVAITSSGTTVYVTNFSSDSVSVFTRNTSTGALTAASPATLATGVSPFGVVVPSDENNLYVLNVGGATISMYTRNSGVPSGTFTSGIIDTNNVANFTTVSFTATTPAGTAVTVDVRAGNVATPDGTWSAWVTGLSSGGDISALVGYRYAQYKLTLTTSDLSATPSVGDVTINYGYYNSSGSLISSAFNTSSSGNVLGSVAWTATTPAGTTVKFQLRTAPDSAGSPGTWTSWLGPDGTSSTYFTDNTGESLPAAFTDVSNDQWFQYQAFLSQTSGATPTLTAVTVTYVVNAAPEYDTAFGTNGITVSQISDSNDPNWGKVKIDYRVRDVDTNDGTSTPGFVTPSFQYDSGAGFTTILSGSLSANALTNKAVDDVDYNTYTVYWDAMTDIPDTYDGTLSVRVIANDNEGANNTATATDSIAFDSKDPVLGGVPLIVDASTTPATLTLSATDDSSFEMRIGLLPDTTDGTYVAYNASATKALATNPDTVYVQFRDVYGNESAVTSASSTETPSLVMIQDISNVSTSEYRLFASWRAVDEPVNGFANYKLYRSDDDITYSLLTTTTSRSVNFFIDDTVLFDTVYYYKVKMTDNLGNVSWFSSTLTGKANGAQDSGEGGGGSETTPPIISNVSSSAISTTQATILWDTDELSDSTVGFSTSEGVFIDEIGMASFADTAAGSGQHAVVLTGLSPSTTYYYQVKSSDPSGNEEIDNNGGDGYTFTTTPGPAISGVALESASNTQATIVWNTDIDSSTYVSYSTSVVNGALVSPTEVGSGTLTSSHTQTITSLTTGTLYYFSVKSVDGSSNIATDNNGGNFYQFTTTTDSTGPVISTIDDSVTTADKAVITWLTDEQANSQVRYALVSGGPYTATPATANYSEDHYTILTDLVSDTTYYYKVVSSDLSGNQTVSDESSFITLQGTEFQHDPLSSLTGVSAPLVTNANAIIAATTDQPAICTVEYGTTPGSYGATPESETLLNQEHSIRLSSLIFSTTYYYQVTCEDNLGTILSSGEESFTTSAESGGGSGTAPTISGLDITDITGSTALVTWTTNELSSGSVYYGVELFDENVVGEGLINSDIANFTRDHSVTLEGLLPNTKYILKVSSADAFGNSSFSAETEFTTEDAPFFENIRSTIGTDFTSATITWITPIDTDSVVEFGTEVGKYPRSEKDTKKTKEHSVTLSGLSEGASYVYRIKGTDGDAVTRVSAGVSFLMPLRPTISSIDVSERTPTTTTLNIRTNVPSTALVTLKKGDEDAGSQGTTILGTEQNIILRNLEPNSTYDAVVSVRSESGAERNEEYTFETEKDEKPPQVIDLKTESAIALGNRIQIAITFKTNEPAVSKLLYKKGMTGEEKEMLVSDVKTENHSLVTKDFESGATYFFRVKLEDVASNAGTSNEYAISTPKQKEDIIQIISKNLRGIFGWAIE